MNPRSEQQDAVAFFADLADGKRVSPAETRHMLAGMDVSCPNCEGGGCADCEQTGQVWCADPFYGKPGNGRPLGVDRDADAQDARNTPEN